VPAVRGRRGAPEGRHRARAPPAAGLAGVPRLGQAERAEDAVTPLRFDPSERLLLLSLLLDELPDDDESADAARTVAQACFAVVRHMRGQLDDAATIYAINRAAKALRAARRRDAA